MPSLARNLTTAAPDALMVNESPSKKGDRICVKSHGLR